MVSTLHRRGNWLSLDLPVGRTKLSASRAQVRAIPNSVPRSLMVVPCRLSPPLSFSGPRKSLNNWSAQQNTALRINPDFELRGSGMKMAGSATPFGMVPETAVELLRDAPSKSIRFSGLHIYAGSQCLDAEAIGDAQEASLNLAADLLSVAREHAVDVNIGGGFGIPYFARETALDIATVGQRLFRFSGQIFASGSPMPELSWSLAATWSAKQVSI